ncbi:glycosyltransferase [Microcoleus sp. FACHB-1515]|uniref:glycosyltransferase n=1 Tax=Cyanophyceae TaxID=3028117 RepID=UPI0016886C55|nr:glycosyltransferase [Microcoleus sp. FACHB-1515]MBD2089463.1 glycosyltransferase [Microcoleus sp. FACHB-1515]
MSEFHPYRAVIPAVSDRDRPLWSVMIPTYHCADYLRQTLAGVLAQDLGADVMQIQVVDDHSTLDDPEAVVRELGQGRVEFYRQPQNVGHTRNFATCLERSRGHLVHLLHGDDCVLDGFYVTLQRAFAEHPEIGAAFCRQIYMDEQGHWQAFSALEQPDRGILANWLEKIAVYQRIQTPSIAVRRSVYEHLGGFDQRLSWAEDWEMWARIAAHYSCWYEPQPLAAYRMHSASSTGRHACTGENIRDLVRAIEVIKPYLPSAKAEELSRRSREHWAFYARWLAYQMLAQGKLDGAIAQVRSGILCGQSFKVRLAMIPLQLRIGLRWMKQKLQPVSSAQPTVKAEMPR